MGEYVGRMEGVGGWINQKMDMSVGRWEGEWMNLMNGEMGLVDGSDGYVGAF
jgi:hypothetical protein